MFFLWLNWGCGMSRHGMEWEEVDWVVRKECFFLCAGVERSGVGRNEVEWEKDRVIKIKEMEGSGRKWEGVERNGKERKEVEGNGKEWKSMI